MSHDLPLLAGMGIGARHEDDGLSYMPMPSEMSTFAAPILPEPEVLEECPEALQVLVQVQAALDGRQPEQSLSITLDDLSASGISLLQQILGEGEVAVQLRTAEPIQIQETLLAGLWWVRQLDSSGALKSQWLEVAGIPAVVSVHAFANARWLPVAALPEGLVNGGSVLVELLEAASQRQVQPEGEPHVVNLSLLPFSPEDHQFLSQQLGEGLALILSRGYGNCRIQSTATPGIWRVQYFNSTDQLILDTLEVTPMPEVACAAPEDLADSAERLREMREVLL